MSGRACWLSALAGGLIFALIALLLATVGSRMPDGTIVEWCRETFGGFIGTVLLLGLAGKLLFDAFLELRIFSEVVCRAMLPNTPVWVISLVLLTVAGSLAAQGTECRGRAAEILFFVVALPLVVILIAVAVSTKYHRVLPMELPAAAGILGGISAMSLVFQGLIFLYFIFPDLRKPAMAKGAALKSVLLTTAAVTVMVFLCLAVYGETLLAEKWMPTLQMLARVSFTGVFLARQDVLLLWFWMASVCIFLSGTLFYGSLMGVRLFHQREEKRKNWLFLCIIAIFALSFLPRNLSAAYQLRLLIAPWLNLIYFIILPIALLLFGRRKGGGDHA